MGKNSLLITIQELADILGVHRSTIEHRWMEWHLDPNIKLRTYKVGRLRKFNREDVENRLLPALEITQGVR